jgi:hypothetical protein
VGGGVLLRDEDLHFWFLDPDIVDDPSHPGREADIEPLLVNNANTWRLRPEAATAIVNFFLASDYVRTFTDLATMEGANEAARRAVNALLERSGSDRSPCAVWNLHEPDALAPLRAYDRLRYRAGLPWDDRFAKALEAVLAAGQAATGVRAGATGPLAAVAPFAEALSAAGGSLSDPVLARTLSLIGLPADAMPDLGNSLPGLGTPVPGLGTALAALSESAAPTAAAGPRRRIRVTQTA